MSTGKRRQTLYRMFDADNQLLYVGVSMNVAQRFAAHRSSKRWWGDINRIDLEHFASRREVLAAEAHAIRTEAPLYNVQYATRPLAVAAGTPRETVQLIDGLTQHEHAVREISLHRRALEAELEEARTEEREAIVAALDSGMKQVQVCALTGYTREHVRRIAIAVRDGRATGT